MKVCIIQPEYSSDYSLSDESFTKELELLDKCDDSMDIIVMPESCDIPCLAKTKADAEKSVEKYNEIILKKASETAKRCNSLLFINARSKTDKGYRNTTYAFDRNGKVASKYFKQHLVPGEFSIMELDIDLNKNHTGSAIVKPDDIAPYPRVCAHRGFNTIAPENSMPAWGVAIAMGADEIEFDLWETKDGILVSCHDATLERVSNGEGKIYEHTYEELKQLDFDSKFNEKFKGMGIVTFEEILQKYACHVIMNIHIKTVTNDSEYDPKSLEKIIALIDKYDCRKYVYFMCGNDNFFKVAQEIAPDICRCCGAGNAAWEIVDRAIKYGCKKVQFFKDRFNQEMIDKAHANGIICNAFYADDVEKAKRYIDMGIDTILTNNYNLIAQAVREHLAENNDK